MAFAATEKGPTPDSHVLDKAKDLNVITP
jgi:hypothetical protein